jgi:hypothetical protein
MERATGTRTPSRLETWPDLPLEAWKDTYATVQLWSQIVGKVRLALAPPVNHWWHVTLNVTARGLTTSPIPYGTDTFQIDFDFLDHQLRIDTSAGTMRMLALEARTVADFYHEFTGALHSLGIEVRIWTMPQEIADPIPFERDAVHATYDPEYAQRHWRVLVQADRVLNVFRSRFLGKCSPVHFFWGGFDLAVTRFSGRRAPLHPAGMPQLADWVVREAYSHEVSSCGFWPGAEGLPEPIFYAYAYPEPDGFKDYPVAVAGSYYHPDLHEFILPYRVLRTADDPDAVLLAFLQRTYEAAADRGAWDRAALERQQHEEVVGS